MERVNFFIGNKCSNFVTYIVTKNNLVIAKVYDSNLNLKQTITTIRTIGEVNIDIMLNLYTEIYKEKIYGDNQHIVDRMYLIEDDEWNFLGLNQ